MLKRFVLSFFLVSCILFFISAFTGCERKKDTGLSFGNLITGSDYSSESSGDVESIQQMSYISYIGLSAIGVAGPESIPSESPAKKRGVPSWIFTDINKAINTIISSPSGAWGVTNKIVDYFNKMAKGEISGDGDGWNTISHSGDMYYKTRITARGKKGEYFYINSKEDLEKLTAIVQGTGYKVAITQIEIKVYFGGMDVYEVINCESSPKKAKFILTAGTRTFSSGWLMLDETKSVLYDGTATLTDPGTGLGNITGSFTVMNNGGAISLTGSVSVDQDGMIGIFGINLTSEQGGAWWTGTAIYDRPRYSGMLPGGGTWVSEAVHESSSLTTSNWVQEAFRGSNGYAWY